MQFVHLPSEVGGGDACIPTHYQLLKCIMDEHILALQEKEGGRERGGGREGGKRKWG